MMNCIIVDDHKITPWIILLLSLHLGLSNGYVICEYDGRYGYNVTSQKLKDMECDIIVNDNGYVNTSFNVYPSLKNATGILREYNCYKKDIPLYFGVDMCHHEYIDPRYENAYLVSVEQAVDWVIRSLYDGIYINLCTVVYTNKVTALKILEKLKSEATKRALPYGFGIIGKPTNFSLENYASTASFITVVSQAIKIGKNRITTYNDAYDIDSLVGHWLSQQANRSQLVFGLPPYVLYHKNSTDVILKRPCGACKNKTLEEVDEIISTMKQDITRIATLIKTNKMKGAHLRWIDRDDLSQVCGNEISPVTKALIGSLKNETTL